MKVRTIYSVERNRRRYWIWVLTGAVVLTVAVLTVAAALNRSPYAFLDKYRPKRYDVDLQKEWVSLPPATKQRKYPKLVLLEFKFSDADAVLADMKRSLTARVGFTGVNLRQSPQDGEASWEFIKGRPLAIAFSEITDGSAYFEKGSSAAFMKELFLWNAAKPHNVPVNQGGSEVCVVLIAHEETWVERGLNQIRSFFHL